MLSSAPPAIQPERLTPAQRAAKEPLHKVLREFAQAYQAFALYDEASIRPMGLTRPQFDVIATLGNTPGLTMGEIAEKTLVTKGTLTGIVDRLETKGLVRRQVPPQNRRCFLITLTQEGEAVFNHVFPAHISNLKSRFAQLSETDREDIYRALKKLRAIFE
jgi:MarR family transcriptional regulator, 2-MHQ and catechol-resistance regulon repressor